MSTSTEHPINSKDWYKAYSSPSERSHLPLPQLTPAELQRRTKGRIPGQHYVIIDVRRADCETLIPGAINIPAQSIAASATTLVDVLSHIDLVVFYCSQSKGRGPRAAGWYADALEKALPPQAIVSDRVAILKGGIVAWEAEYGCGDITQRGGLAPSDTCGIRHL